MHCWIWTVVRVRARTVLHSSIGHWRPAFFVIDGNSRLLPLFLKVGSAMMCRTIVVLQYCQRSINFLKYWFTDTCTRTWMVSWRIVNTALLRVDRLSQIYSNTLLLFWSQFRMGVRLIQSTRTFLRPLIKCVIVCSWIKCRLMLSHPVVSGWVLTFLVE
jgi:hypothetical protein